MSVIWPCIKLITKWSIQSIPWSIYTWGNLDINPWALAASAAFWISSIVASGFPSLMFSAILQPNRMGSCDTMPMFCRSQFTFRSVRGLPSRSIYKHIIINYIILYLTKLEWGCLYGTNTPTRQPIQTQVLFTPLSLGHILDGLTWNLCVKFDDCTCKGAVVMHQRPFSVINVNYVLWPGLLTFWPWHQ